jgi:hypothetical protein
MIKATNSSKRILSCFAALVALTISHPDANGQSCQQPVYSAFDSRLETVLVGRVPENSGATVGFEVVEERVFIAHQHDILGLRRKSVISLPFPSPIDALAVDGSGGLFVQTAAGVLKLGEDATFAKDGAVSSMIKGKVLNSGSDTFMDVQKTGTEIDFTARRRNGGSLLVLTARGELRTAAWNDQGLAAVVGNTLYYWQPGSNEMLKLASNTGLINATNACVVGSQRVVVHANSAMLLIDHGHLSFLVGMRGMCSFEKGILYLFDQKNNLVWAARGINKIGPRETDEKYATELLKKLKPTDVGSPQFLEATRILGCEKARGLLSQQAKPLAH